MDGVLERSLHLVQLLILAQFLLLSLERGQTIVDVLQEFGNLLSLPLRVFEDAARLLFAFVVDASTGNFSQQFEPS